jgi:hypothetical protein
VMYQHSGPDHTYEEIRDLVLNILSGREGALGTPHYDGLKSAVSSVFEKREGRTPVSGVGGYMPSLSRNDSNLLLEVFWGLFREGIITLGADDSNRQFPWFRLSEFGKRLADSQEPYFFHDVSSYETLIRTEVPGIDDVTLLYLKEAMQDFKSGCLLSASVMLGVAAEHTFMKLLEAIESNGAHFDTFRNVYEQRTMLRRLNKFKNILDQNQGVLPPSVKEDLDTNFMGITSIIRTFRNDSGHPTGKIISREQCYVLLQLFVPYCKKMYELIDVLGASAPTGRP